MKKTNLIKILNILFVPLLLGFVDPAGPWEKMAPAISEPEVQCLLVLPNNPQVILAGTTKAIYRSVDHGQTFKNVFSLQGSLKSVNKLAAPSRFVDIVFAAADDGVFASYDNGTQWVKIYHVADALERRVMDVIADGRSVYLATLGGMRRQKMMEDTWHPLTGELGRQAVFHLEQDGDYVFAATARVLYRIDAGMETDHATKIFRVGFKDDVALPGDGEQLALHDFDIEIKDLLIVDGVITLVTVQGVYESRNRGDSWQRIAADGLPVEEVRSLLFENGLWAGTGKGVYIRQAGRWTSLYKGMETQDVRQLASDGAGTIYAATGDGIYAVASSQLSVDGKMIDTSMVIARFEEEPSIREVQAMAVEYAEVHPDKIRSWRRGAKARAFLPTLAVGLDRSATDLFHWNTGASPDELQKGREYLDWDVSLSWDFGDLIWSTDQTTIDSRAKLMVELREDILDQITRLYFERRRLQMELAALESLEPHLRLDKEMRVDELTALIDALTGGAFSDELSAEKDIN